MNVLILCCLNFLIASSSCDLEKRISPPKVQTQLVKNVQPEVETLDTMKVEIDKAFKNMHTGLNNSSKSRERIKRKLDSLEFRLQVLENMTRTQPTVHNGTVQRLQSLEEDVNHLKIGNNFEKIAFHAKLPNDATFRTSQTLIFNDTLTDIGGVYNSHLGTFTAPSDGIYVFMVTVFKISGSVKLEIQVDDETVAETTSTRKHKEQMTMHAVVKLQMGEMVRTKRILIKKATTKIQGGSSFFSGYKI